MPAPRPLPRSLIPLPGESLPGFLLRLSFRLGIAPGQLAELTGLAPAGRGRRAPAALLAGIPETAIRTFTRMTRLAVGQAAELGLDSWQGRYPLQAAGPGRTGASRRPLATQPVFIPATRYCPECLAGDGSAIQESLGGPWLKAWHLPVVFACPAHQRLLEHLCPECLKPVHDRRPGTSPAILPAMRTAGLHPAQCRTELVPARRYRPPACCGARLDQARDRLPADPRLIALQGKILDLLGPGAGSTISAGMPATPAGYFADLQALGLLACWTWPSARHLSPSEDTASATDEHVASLRRYQTPSAPAARTRFGRPPADAAASAGLVYIADSILGGSPDDIREFLREFLPSSPRKASRTYWGLRVLRSPPCSDGLQAAYGPLLRTFTKEDGQPQGRRNAVLRPGRWGPENIPAFLEQTWFEDHLACLECGSTVKAARRIAAATLVQWTAGGSIGEAARYLGFNPGGGQYAPTTDLARWLSALEPGRFTRALREIALRLDLTSDLVNYQHRRQLLRDWALTTREWNDIISRLPPVPGPVQPIMDDRKRQEASAFIWARVTQGEPRFAPRPIEASQPEPVRRDWTSHRANTWHKLASPGRIVHYAELRSLLIEHSDQLARDIDNGTEANGRGARRRLGENTAVTENPPM